MKDHEAQLRKERFFFRKCCAFCRSEDDLQLDSIQPYTWVDDSIWQLSDYELNRRFIQDIQILCDSCLRRKKQVWKKYKKEGGFWFEEFLRGTT